MKIQLWKIPATFNAEGKMELDESKATLVEEQPKGTMNGGEVMTASTEIGQYNNQQIRDTQNIKGQFIYRKKLVS
jgi:hypothetical protein